MNWKTGDQENLLNVIRRRNERDILLKQLTQTKAELEKRQQEQKTVRIQWQREQADVDRLTRLSWASVYYDLVNGKEQQMSKEEAEAQQARLQLVTTLTDLKSQVEQSVEKTKQQADGFQRFLETAG